jgi:wyosine [tRNA(Phe)-imidazoG37] synthetase (radical SAM superfamily)
MKKDRRSYYEPDIIFRDVQTKVRKAREIAEQIDYLTFVPDGEPTLDENLGKEITLLKKLEVPIGVITNSSLLWREDVREELALADWVSVKIDAVRDTIWQRINRPHKAIEFSQMLDGIRSFAEQYAGTLVTETMLVRGINDHDECVKEVAEFVHALHPATAYLSIPTRPPAKKWVRSPDEQTLNRAYQILAERVTQAEYLVGYEGDAFASTGNVETDLLGITAVHPMRKEAVDALLARSGSSWEVVDRLTARGDLVVTAYGDHLYYLRRFVKYHAAC